MRLTRLVVDNLLSFEHLELAGIDPGLTTIVGPNGSGKTNLARLLTLAATALDWVEERAPQVVPDPQSTQGILSSYAAARYRHAPRGAPQRLELGIELTSTSEREQLTCFVQSAIVSTVLSRGRQQQDGPALAAWALEEVTAERLSTLASGSLVLDHPGSAHAPWQVAYEFHHDDSAYRWVLVDPHGRHGIVTKADHTASARDQLQTEDLSQALFGIVSSGTLPSALPSPLPPFSLGKLCPASGKVIELLVQAGGGGFDRDLEPHRRFAEIVGLTSFWAPPNRAFSLAAILRQMFHRGVVLLDEHLRGADTGSRALPTGRYTLDQLSRPTASWEPSDLPLRLFHLKNGDGNERQRFERIRQMFERFAPGRRLDLHFEAVLPPNGSPQPPFPSAASSGQQEQAADPEFVITVVIGEGSAENTWELPVTLTGAGVWEALVLAEAVADSGDRVIVLDEPALNLHPAWQRLLASQVREAPGQFLLITHSPYLVPIERREDLARLVRVARLNGATTLHRFPADAIDARVVAADLQSRIVREFSLSADARALLFAAGAVLVEGETELGALPAWFECSEAAGTHGTPGRLHLGLYSVGGEKNFKPVLALLAALGIPWVIVCDGGPFRPDMGGSHIFRQLVDANATHPSLEKFVGNNLPADDRELTFEEIVRVGRDHGIFTLASGWTRADGKQGIPGDESFEAFARRVHPDKLAEAKSAFPSSKVRRGRWLAEQVSCPQEVDCLYRDILDALVRKGMPLPK